MDKHNSIPLSCPITMEEAEKILTEEGWLTGPCGKADPAHHVNLFLEGSEHGWFLCRKHKEQAMEKYPTDIINLAKEFLEERARYGEKEYGQRLHPFVKGRFSLNDAIEEAADLFVYLLQFREELDSVIELVDEVVHQACWMEKEQRYDSMAISTYADALRFLEAVGVVEIISETGDRVIAKRKPKTGANQ